MGLEDVKKVVQPELEQDFDALYEEFVRETGQKEVSEFLLHLHDYGLISDAIINKLTDDSTLAKQHPGHAGSQAPIKQPDWGAAFGEDDEDDEATVLRKVDDLMTMTANAKSTTDTRSPQKFRPPKHGQRPPAPPIDQDSTVPRLDPDATVPPLAMDETSPRMELDSTSPRMEIIDPNAAPEDPNSRRRTSFRRRGDGKLEETGEFVRQRRRRREKPAPKREKVVDKRYMMLGMVGEGAMGQVLLAKDQTLKRKVALKEMSSEIADNPPLASKFMIEAQITAQLDHPNIVPVYDLQGDSAYTMKLIKGETVEQQVETIRERLKKRQPLLPHQTLEARLEMFIKVCEAMSYAHSRGVVHRDLKPENVMIGEFGEVYVMDWGIAHVMPGKFEDPVEIRGMVDEGDLIIGTAGYMSPEQADARTEDLTGASDQYALGLILQELITLNLAVTGKNVMHIITRHQMGEVDRMVHINRERIAPELVAIVRKATQFKIERRYPSVAHLADDIRRFLRGEAVAAKPDNPWQALVRFTGRHRQLTLLAVASVIMFSLFLVTVIGVYTQVALTRAAARQQAVSNLTSTVGRQASFVDGQLLRMEGLLLILSTTSEDMLTIGEPMTSKVYTTADYDDPISRPPDLEEGRSYQMPISLQHSAFFLPENENAMERYETIPKLLPLNRHFNKVLLRSHSEEAAQMASKLARRTLKDVGVPITWAYVALESGAYDVYPGHGGYPADFDPRTTPWYKRAARADGPVWSPPTEDANGNEGIIVPCSIGLHDSNGGLLGVAGIDLDFEYFSDRLMPIEDLADTQAKALIVDAEGRVLIDPDNPRPEGRKTYPIEYVKQQIEAKRSGVYEADGDITVYTRMSSLDWYYVVSGPSSELLEAMQ